MISFGDKRLPERFWKKVVPAESGCWLWIGAYACAFGYGSFGDIKTTGRVWHAHRLAYDRLVGQVGNLHVLHRCDVPPCVNPDHLFLGTDLDNARDKMLKGRHKSPIAVGFCKRGHPFTGENVFVSSQGKRGCRACYKMTYQKRNDRVYAEMRSLGMTHDQWLEHRRNIASAERAMTKCPIVEEK